jgi:hypothetical protein
MNEVRRTADSPKGQAGAKLTRSEKQSTGRGAWSGWRMNGRKSMLSNQGDLSWCQKEQDRSQSPHSSDEAANPRGAKGGRKVEP